MFKKQIELLRRKNGWSQAELAERLHISPSAVGMYEQGRREPPIDVLIAMSREFDVSIDYLLTGRLNATSICEIAMFKEYATEAFHVLKSLSREELIILLATQLITN